MASPRPTDQQGSAARSKPTEASLQVTELLNQRLTRGEMSVPNAWQPVYQRARLMLVVLCSRVEQLLTRHWLYQLLLQRSQVPPLVLFLLTLGSALAVAQRVYLHTAGTIFQLVGFAYPVTKTIQTLLTLDGDRHPSLDDDRPSATFRHRTSTPSATRANQADSPPLSAAGRPSAWDYHPMAALDSARLPQWATQADEAHRWLRYWLLYASLQLSDHTCGWLLRSVPYYSFLRIVTVLWAQHPWSHTSGHFYRSFALPLYRRWLHSRWQSSNLVSAAFADQPWKTMATPRHATQSDPPPHFDPLASHLDSPVHKLDSATAGFEATPPLDEKLAPDATSFSTPQLRVDTTHFGTIDPLAQSNYCMDMMPSALVDAGFVLPTPLTSPHTVLDLEQPYNVRRRRSRRESTRAKRASLMVGSSSGKPPLSAPGGYQPRNRTTSVSNPEISSTLSFSPTIKLAARSGQTMVGPRDHGIDPSSKWQSVNIPFHPLLPSSPDQPLGWDFDSLAP
ncbi:hypothetical protein H4R34_001480 [Dimargaris verticillata]|uniref:Uncharacterized protein n=1 Tax=Dimargaris verticillata TaxID=2761393 RepID=A0A9W8B8E8_9FUNG|nr:hypothetical protein H4R34_001480 [Dimargaris verticillata]